jgi:hypothetical protein
MKNSEIFFINSHSFIVFHIFNPARDCAESFYSLVYLIGNCEKQSFVFDRVIKKNFLTEISVKI